MKKVCEEGVDIDRLLIVTFTNAAAAEMRERIHNALLERIEEEPENEHLQKQLVLLMNAQITTIHSFCLYLVRNHFFGPFGMTDTSLQCGNLEQGNSKSDAVIVANTSDSPVKVEFKDVSDNLSLSVKPNPIPANSTAELSYTVTAERGIWGKNTYWATPVINGRTYTTKDGGTRIGVKAFTKENFDKMSEAEKAQGPMPRFENSTYSFNRIKKGEEIHAEFTLTNSGKSPFCVYKVDTDACCYSHSDIPVAKPGEKVSFRVHVNTENMPQGETLVLVTLTTNSPLRPIVNLFIAGWID